MVEKNVQDSGWRLASDAAQHRCGPFVELKAWVGDGCETLWGEGRSPERDFSVADVPTGSGQWHEFRLTIDGPMQSAQLMAKMYSRTDSTCGSQGASVCGQRPTARCNSKTWTFDRMPSDRTVSSLSGL